MSQVYRDIATILKNNGLSVTKQRLLVFNILEGREPLTMYELYGLAKGQLDRASLYRIVAVFESLGIVQRVTIGWKYKLELSDKFADHHHHLTCLKCHKIMSIRGKDLEAFINGLGASHDFQPIEHQVEIQGYCKECTPKSQANNPHPDDD